MKRKWLMFFSITCILTLLCGCGKKIEEPDDEMSNHGYTAIMETENGYYYNYGYTVYAMGEPDSAVTKYDKQQLRYYDKETGETILLCNKPECEHKGGDACTATFQNMTISNSILYDGSIYIYGREEDKNIIRFSLYRAALDGSSIDKVGTVFEAENTIGEAYSGRTSPEQPGGLFIIHRGYAYLPYYLEIGKGSKGFMGGGLVQMNLKTGETKTIYEMEYKISPFPYDLRACGDYVYMDLQGYMKYVGTKRYVISKDRLEYLPAEADSEYHGYYEVVTEERLYNVYPEYNTESGTTGEFYMVSVFDGTTGEWLDENFFTDITTEECKEMKMILPYEDMLAIATEERVVFYGSLGENRGKKLGEIAYEFDGKELAYGYQGNVDFKISKGKLYRICSDYKGIYGEWFENGYYDYYEVFCCTVEDILKGKGSWELAFSYQTGRTAE